MVYLLDDMQLAVLTRVKSRLYDEMTRLTADDRRDLANAMDAVLHNVESVGAMPDDPYRDGYNAGLSTAMRLVEEVGGEGTETLVAGLDASKKG